MSNVGTGEPILQRDSKGMLCLFLTRTMRLPWDCIKGIRRSRLGTRCRFTIRARRDRAPVSRPCDIGL